LADENYDLAIIGGGVNGCGIARDAAGRGLKVFLAEKGDLGGATSSASTKLIHGGLRYLEHFSFRLVREALTEREVLLRCAPHIIAPLRFVLPHHKGLRPRWMLRLGLFIYDHLGGRKILPPTQSISLRHNPAGIPLKEKFRHGFEYSDCWVDDARLVVLNAVDARERHAEIAVHTAVVEARRADGVWKIGLAGPDGRRSIRARALVDATGPFIAGVEARVIGSSGAVPTRLVKGSHIVVPRLFNHERAYIFQNADGRVVFAIPFQGDFTVIGTTDIDYNGDPSNPTCGIDEIAYLCAAASEYFAVAVEPKSVVWTYSGVRPLVGDKDARAQDATRDYLLHLDAPKGAAPLLSVYGGKITTYRRLAEAALARLRPHLPMGPAWTQTAPLPGGDFAVGGLDLLARSIAEKHPFLDRRQAMRFARTYGTRAMRVLGGARRAADLGRAFGADLTEAEADYLIREEWASSADDILWRRTKLGLRLTPQQQDDFHRWMDERMTAASETAP
jgi:glycerol-3-phosphate dehydrogenase